MEEGLSPFSFVAPRQRRNKMRLMGLEGDLVVVAIYDGNTEPVKSSGEKLYRFATGDVGVLSWAMIGSFTYEPRVIWDDDPAHLPRRIIPNNLRVIGIETGGCRFICTKPSIKLGGDDFLRNNFSVMESA